MSEQSTNPESPSGGRRWLGYVQAGLIILVIAVALYFARAPERMEFGPAVASGDAVQAVEVVIPTPAVHAHQLELTGTVTLNRKVTLLSEVVGRVVWVSPNFVNGGRLQAGEAFVRIDPRKYEIEFSSAEMAVAQAQAQLQLAKGATGPDAGALIAEAEAVLGRAEAALSMAQLNLERTEISLPFDARVMSSELEVGDLVGLPEAVGKLSVLGIVYRPAALQVRVPVSVEDLASLDPAIGRRAEVRTVFGTYDAELVRVSSVVAAKSRLSSAFLEFSDAVPPDELPVPGTFAEVTIVGPERDDVFMLPEAAAREYDNIWIVQEGVLQALRPTTVGRSTEGWIVEAFDPADGVVVSVLARAREGLRVAPQPVETGQ